MEAERLARISWEGDSREVLASFPDEIRSDFGFALFQVQQGKKPSIQTRRMDSIGPGVYELKAGDQSAWYRVIYLSKIDDVIFILHSFQKQGRKTDHRDLLTAKKRLREVRQRIEAQRKKNGR